VALNQVVDYQRALSSSSIHRVDGKNVVTLTAKAETKNLSQIMRDLERAADEFYLPVGYNIQLGEQLLELDENIFQFLSSMMLAIVLIYIVMAALFESFVLPFSILTTVPLSLAGAIWALYFTNTQMDTITMIGCILMAGVIVNNGIVIVDHINQLRNEGLPRLEAIVLAGQDRFRPVMMTAITTILGLVPLAMAKTGGAATFAGLGRALVGGMTVGTILTLVVVPLFYTLIDDLQHGTRDFLAGISRTFKAHGSREPKSAAPAPVTEP
jgi:hydrophobic/amphiphilic exporter-1 (mainly G- bacteria), HAE1 family